MKIDAVFGNLGLGAVPQMARMAEQLGFDAVWSQETSHDPFLPHPLIAEHTNKLASGTSIAVAFSRSPMNLAYTAWDLAAQSDGRFMLGLGTQVKAHIERRFGMPWPASPIAKMREMVLAIRAIWESWQNGTKLNYRGEIYRLGLMTPFFTPPPLHCQPPPILIAGVNAGLAKCAGEVADGFLVHPFHTLSSLKAITLPAIAKGLEKSGRNKVEFEVSTTVFVAQTESEIEQVRQQVAFYASTPSYRSVLEQEGVATIADALSGLARHGKWNEMAKLIPDSLLEQVCVMGNDPTDMAEKIVSRYEGIANRIALYRPLGQESDIDFWQEFIRSFRVAAG